MKEKYNITDIHAIVNELKRVAIGKYLQNIYSSKKTTIYLKLSTKEVIFVESGSRIHLIESYDTDINFFAAKLRECIKNARIKDIEQLGLDRIVVIYFEKYKLVLEFFSLGNLILLNREDDKIIHILRPIASLGIVKNSVYNCNPVELNYFQGYYANGIKNEDVANSLASLALKTEDSEDILKLINSKDLNLELPFGEFLVNKIKSKFDQCNREKDGLKLAVAYFLSFIENFKNIKDFGEVTLKNGNPETLNPFNTQIKANEDKDDEFSYFYATEALDNVGNIPLKMKNEDIHKFIKSNKKVSCLHFQSFNQAAQFYFERRSRNLNNSNPKNAQKEVKSERIKKSQNIYIKQLDNQIHEINKNINEIEFAVDKEDKLGLDEDDYNPKREIIRGILRFFKRIIDDKINWAKFDRMYAERGRDNLYFGSIISYSFINRKCRVDLTILSQISHKLKEEFKTNSLIRKKADEELASIMEELSGKERAGEIAGGSAAKNEGPGPNGKNKKFNDFKKGKKSLQSDTNIIEMDMLLNLNKNIENFYRSKKKYEAKRDKTVEAMEKLIVKFKPKRKIVSVQNRKGYWFEKFNYFISNAGNGGGPENGEEGHSAARGRHIVVGGSNGQQNEIVVKRHSCADDIYFHCDVHGASSVILHSINEATIKEASYMSLVHSKCWALAVIHPVFWVNMDQVSKTPNTGEYLTKGGFVIRGKKNFIHPHRLEYGIAIVFKMKYAKDILDFSNDLTKEDFFIDYLSKAKKTDNINDADNINDPDNINDADNINDTDMLEMVNDQIEHAMPISGPWCTLKNYQYSLRICPGSFKKQKIAQLIMNKFHQMSLNRPGEDFIRAIGLQEYTNVVPGKSRIAK